MEKGQRFPIGLIQAAIIVIFTLTLLTVYMVTDSIQAQEQPYIWSEAIILSTDLAGSWFPDMAIDNQGQVHVIWENHLEGWERRSGSNVQIIHSAMHIVWDNGSWSKPNDIFSRWSPPGVIYRLALAADNFGHNYMTVLLDNQIFLRRSKSDASHSGLAWSDPKQSSTEIGITYMSDIAADSQGAVHVVWQETAPVPQEDDTTLFLFDIFYRRSEDGGQTWSTPVNLSISPVSEGRAQVKIDDSDTIYVTWDEGGQEGVVVASGTVGTSNRGVLIISRDGGKSWLSPSKFWYPENTNSQIAPAGNGQGGILVVWRSETGLIYYDWSKDWGKSWSPPASIPGITAYSHSGFDAYDMAVDSAGAIHLVAAGLLSPDYPSRGIYHLAWDGSTWSSPALIYDSEWRKEDPLAGMYPKIAVSRGNRLHVVWHTHADSDYGICSVWYSDSQSPAPAQILPPTPTPIPTPAPTLSTEPTSTPTAMLIPELISIPVSSDVPNVIFTENDDVLLLLQSLIPIILIIIVIFIVKYIMQRR